MFCRSPMLYFGKNSTKRVYVVRVNKGGRPLSGHAGCLKIERGGSMGELYNPFPKLPKNIRQIGDTDQVVRLNVEDYVEAYLTRLNPVGNQTLRVGLLMETRKTMTGLRISLSMAPSRWRTWKYPGRRWNFPKRPGKRRIVGSRSRFEADRSGMVYLRHSVEPAESPELLETAQPVL